MQDKEFRLIVKLAPGADAASSLSATLLRLSDTGFAWKRTESRDATGLVTLIGTVPQRAVARLMADPGVVRVEAIRDGDIPKPAAPQPPQPSNYIDWLSRQQSLLEKIYISFGDGMGLARACACSYEPVVIHH